MSLFYFNIVYFTSNPSERQTLWIVNNYYTVQTWKIIKTKGTVVTSWVQAVLPCNWFTDSRTYICVRKFAARYGVQTEPEAHLFCIPTDVEVNLRTVDRAEDKYKFHTEKKEFVFFYFTWIKSCFPPPPPPPPPTFHFHGLNLIFDIYVDCNCVGNRWQLYITHLHTNNTQNTMKQNTENRTYKTVRVYELHNKNT